MAKCSNLFKVITIGLFLSLGFQSGLVGCAFSKNKNKAKPELVELGDKLNKDSLKIEMLETEVFNEYFIKFSWPSDKDVRVEVQEGDVITRDNGLNRIVIPIEGGDTKQLEVFVYNSLGGLTYREVIKQTAPRDLRLNEERHFEEDTYWNYNRIVLGESARIHLHGNSLKIIAKKIYFHIGAWIDTDGGIRASNQEQLEGSKIQIEVGSINGILRLNLEGFNGRDGLSGDELDKKNGFVDAYVANLSGAPGLPGQSKLNSPKANDGYSCLKQPTNGTDGKQGAPGTDGQDGEPGGNTGSLQIEVENPRQSNLTVEVVARPGRPGKGGAGGIGRRGGQGGPPGVGADGCGKARAGHDGPRGQTGQPGKDGAIGKVGKISATPGVILKIQD